MKKSLATLQERLSDWIPWDKATFECGVCLGFWVDAGAPPPYDVYHGIMEKIHLSLPPTNAILLFLDKLVEDKILDKKIDGQNIFLRYIK